MAKQHAEAVRRIQSSATAAEGSHATVQRPSGQPSKGEALRKNGKSNGAKSGVVRNRISEPIAARAQPSRRTSDKQPPLACCATAPRAPPARRASNERAPRG